MSKLYVLTRRDLSKRQQMVQACHAVAEHCLKSGTWKNNTIVVLGTKDETELLVWLTLLKTSGYNPETFTEPYYNNSLTSLAVHGEGVGDLFASLPLL